MIKLVEIKNLDIVQSLNYNQALATQKELCLKCGKKLGENVFYRLDQTINPQINEIYCVQCGKYYLSTDHEVNETAKINRKMWNKLEDW